MINIKVPSNNISERKYIIEILFNEFLGLEYKLEVGGKDYEIVLPNCRTLFIKDTFFNKHPNDLEYLKQSNIPTSIEELDIFAACFFMLTRWEEYVDKTRDEHNRFPATASLAYREGFLDRPIVNEKVEELKLKLRERDSSLVFKERTFELVLTHDVDSLYFWQNPWQLIKLVGGDIVKRKNIRLAIERIRDYRGAKTQKQKDPFDTFDWLMDQSEAVGLKSRFYFMSGGDTPYDSHYKIGEPKARALIKKIQSRGHMIGIHPSYDAYHNVAKIRQEKELLEKVSGEQIVEGREHYLRFEVPTTWQAWEENGMEIDSTCGYADREGFRCGTGDMFSVFNILTRQKLQLKEKPLIVMDGNFTTYQADTDHIEMEQKITRLIRRVKQHQGTFVLLWHNSSFYGQKQNEYKEIYKRILTS